MPGLPTFTDFMKATKSHKLTSANEILNEAVLNSYFIRDMLKGRDASEVVRAGSKIKDSIQLSNAGTFSFYTPNATFSPDDSDTLRDIEVGWRFAKTHFAYNDETITLNEGESVDVYVNLKRKYRQSAATDMMNGMEAALWAVPVAGTMESGTGDTPPAYSIPAFVNEATNGLFTGWTTKMGQSPVTEARWKPQQLGYDGGTPEDEVDGLLATMDEMYLAVRFESPDEASEYFENDRLRKMKIVTNRAGHKLYKRMLRAGNDRFINPQDPAYNNPTYAGIPVKYVSTLDNAPLDPNTGAAWAYPVFYWLNLMYLFTVYHTKGYMEQVGPRDGGTTQPFSHAVFFRTWYNLFCRSLQRQGIVYGV